jgi:hypothetical protein
MAEVSIPEWLASKPVIVVDWQLVTDFAPYVASEDLSEETMALTRRIYHQKGRDFPLLSIAIHASAWPAVSGVKISASFKSRKGDWWSDSDPFAAVPLSLFGDLFEMIREAEAVLHELHRAHGIQGT